MQKRTTAQLLAEALAFTGRHATETEQQAAHRRLQRNQMAATELLRLDALRLELQTQLADYKEACTKAETRADQAEGRAKLMAAPAVPQGWRDAATAALTLLNKTQRALGNNLAKHPADHSATVGELMGMHDCRDGFLVRSGLSGILNDTAPSTDEHWPKSQPVRLSASRIGRVYVAGPMTGLPERNFPAFNQEAERLRAEGLQVLNPADHGIVDGADWADYLRHDIAGLASCERIHLLRGWTKSKGACLEMTIAKALGMTVTYQVDAEMEHNNAPAVPQGIPAQEVIDAIEAWKSAWLKVPTFADRVNKATREAITISHNSLFLLLQSAQQAKRMPAGCPTPTGCGPHGCHGDCIAATPAPAPAQEPVDMVPRAALHEVERERDWYKTRAQTMHEHQNGQVWYWQGDGEDHPETLVNSLPVVIRADQLRELIAKPAQEVATLSLSAEDVHAAFTKNFPKTRISQAWISFAADIVQAIAARAAKPAQEVTLTDEEIFKCVQAACLDGSCPDFETFTKQELEDPVVTDFDRAIISALRAKGGK